MRAGATARQPSPHIAAVLAAIAAGESQRAVAERLGMSKWAVEQAVARWRYAAPPPVVVQRRCLCCRHPFDSTGMRLCQTCKESPEFGGLGAVQI